MKPWPSTDAGRNTARAESGSACSRSSSSSRSPSGNEVTDAEAASNSSMKNGLPPVRSNSSGTSCTAAAPAAVATSSATSRRASPARRIHEASPRSSSASSGFRGWRRCRSSARYVTMSSTRAAWMLRARNEIRSRVELSAQ